MCMHLSHKITKEFTCCDYLDTARLSGDARVMHMSTSLTYFGYATLDQLRCHLMPFSKSVLPGDISQGSVPARVRCSDIW